MMSSVRFFHSITIPVPHDHIYRRLGKKSGMVWSEGMRHDEVEADIASACSLMRLQGALKRMDVTLSGTSGIRLESGHAFESARLAAYLEGCGEVLLMAATGGRDIVESIKRGMEQGDMTRSVVFDAVASEMVDAALDWFCDMFNHELIREGKRLKKSRFSAGYGDFSLREQKTIYDLLQLSHLGVDITDYYMLIPEKTVTAVAGIR